MTTTLGKLVGLIYFMIFIVISLHLISSPMNWAEWVTTNAEIAGRLIRAILIGVSIWMGFKTYSGIGVLTDNIVKALVIWSTKKKKSK